MSKVKNNFIFLLLAFINITLFILYLQSTKNLVLLEEKQWNIALLLIIFIVFSIMWMISPGKKKETEETEKIVNVFKINNYEVEVDLLLTDMYDLVKKKEEISYADIYFLEQNNKYIVKMEITTKDGTKIGGLSKTLKEEINQVFKEKYDYENGVETKLIFKMFNDRKEEVVPTEIKEEIKKLSRKEKNKKKKNKYSKKQINFLKKKKNNKDKKEEINPVPQTEEKEIGEQNTEGTEIQSEKSGEEKEEQVDLNDTKKQNEREKTQE